METCKVCGEPLMKEVETFLGTITVARECACKRMINSKQDIEHEKREREARYKKLLNQCFDDPCYEKLNFNADRNQDSQARRIAFNYATNFEKMKEDGSGLFIYGKPDSSKTFYSACIANHLLKEGYSVIMDKPARIIAKVLKNKEEDYIAKIAKVDLLILDDFGTESDSSFRQEVMYDVIDSRYKKSLIVTTNLTSEQFMAPQNVHEERLIGRIMDNCVPIEFEQTNMRWNREYTGLLDLLSK